MFVDDYKEYSKFKNLFYVFQVLFEVALFSDAKIVPPSKVTIGMELPTCYPSFLTLHI